MAADIKWIKITIYKLKILCYHIIILIKKRKVKMKKTIITRLSEEDYKKIVELSKKEDRSINSMMIQLIKRAYEKK